MYPEPLHRLPHAVLAPFSSLLRSSALIQIIQLEGDEPGRRLWREREGALTTLSLLATAHPALKATLALLGDLAQRVAERTALALMLNDNYRVVQRQREQLLEEIVAAGEVSPGLAAELNGWAGAVSTAACAAASAGGARLFCRPALSKLRGTLERKQARVFGPAPAAAAAKRAAASSGLADGGDDLLQSLLHGV